MTDKEPLRITLEDLGLSEPPAPTSPATEPPAQPERPHGKAREAAEQAAYDAQQAATASLSGTPDAGGEAPAAAEERAVAPVRKEP